MRNEITENHFTTEDEALAEIAKRGWHPITLDIDVDDESMHFHDFNALVFVLRGEVRAEYPDGTRETAGPGSRIDASAFVLHREVDSHHRSVFGFDVPLDQISQPINKPPAELPA
jgi:hypothetical protein